MNKKLSNNKPKKKRSLSDINLTHACILCKNRFACQDSWNVFPIDCGENTCGKFQQM